jgi:predicted O-methyltransferase YrrM
VITALKARYGELAGVLPFPEAFRIEQETSRFLFGAARLLRPEVVVETGVANGHSSFVLLEALERNGRGRLHSFDIDPHAGKLVRSKERWALTICDEEHAHAELAATLAEAGKVDFFFHDADHRYLSQLSEYRAAWPVVAPGGLFASDDVDDSRAFFDFCEEVGRQPALLLDNSKVVGACRV